MQALDEDQLFIVVDAVENRYMGELSGGERRADRFGKDRAVDDARDCRTRELVDEFVDRQLAKTSSGLIRAAGRSCE